MTCIVGVQHEGKVFIGGDSAGTGGSFQMERADEKVFVKGDFAYGFCGSYRTGQLLRHSLSPPPYDPRTDADRYLAGAFVDAVRSALRDGGALHQQYNVDRLDGPFLIGWRGRLYSVEEDFQVGRLADPYAATGSGRRVAMGALHVLGAEPRPQQRIKRALEAAARYDAYVAPPFVVVEAPTIT